MKNYLYAFGAILCWASLPLATGSGLAELSPEELMFYSFTSAALFLYFVNIGRSKTFRISFPPLRISLLGIWGIFLYHYIYYHAMERASLTEGAILATTWSFWIVVFSSLLILRRLTLPILVTALLGMGGITMVIAAGKGLNFSSTYTAGYLLALLCGLIWSSFTVLLGRINQDKDRMTEFTILAALLSCLSSISFFPPSYICPRIF